MSALTKTCILSGIILACLTYATHERNKVWKSEISLWQDALTKSPMKPRPRINLGLAYHREGERYAAAHTSATGMISAQDYNRRVDFDRAALREFSNVLIVTIGKTDNTSLIGRRMARVNAANLYLRYERWADAETLISQEINENRTADGVAVLVPGLLDLAIVYMNTGRAAQSLAMLEWVQDHFQNDMMPMGLGKIHGAKGAAYQALKDCGSAMKEYAEAERLDPDLPHSTCF